MEQLNVVGVQFRRAGRIYDFATGELNLRVGDDVVVETERGPSLGKVATVKFVERAFYKDTTLKTILRRARRKDLDQKSANLTPDEALLLCRKKVQGLGLEMSVLQADIQFGGNKVIIYFSAPGRIDFRELVKELASGLKSRVELKQVGARDETKILGGMGVCGREFCCSSFLREFVPVSIKMAKNQNLALNPSKVSGGCGRLLCCLTYENDLYVELRKKMPSRGVRVRHVDEEVEGDVFKSDFLNQLVTFETEAGQQFTFPIDQLQVLGKKPRPAERGTTKEEPDEAFSDAAWGDDLDLKGLMDDESPS